MAKRPSTPSELRDAVERTVQATLGSAERQRERTIDEIAGTVDNLRKGAEASLARGRRALENTRPATAEDLRELRSELRKVSKRLDAIEERLPARRSGSAAKRAPAKRAPAKRAPAKRAPAKRKS
jgi:chromosome segregation ATPase